MEDPQALLQRRRIWGVPPDVVAAWVAACQREHAEMQTRIARLEMQLAQISTERDGANTAIAALKDSLSRLEAEKAEWKGRPETIRAEAIQFVVDAYAEAQHAREQSGQEIAAEKAAAREAIEVERRAAQAEVAAIRRDLEAERRQHEEAIAALQQRHAETIASLDALGRNLLAQLGRADVTIPASTVPPQEHADAALRDDDTAAPISDTMQGHAPSPLPASESLPTPVDSLASHSHDDMSPEESSVNPGRAIPPEDTMLARALDELEAILRGNRKAGSEH